MKPPIPKLSKTLTRRTKLTPAQLKRARGQAGNGTASRYDSNGTQSLALTRKLVKAMRKAKRFVLYSDQLGRRVYVSTIYRERVRTTNLRQSRGAPIRAGVR